MESEDYIKGIESLRERVEAIGVEAYEAAIIQQIAGAARAFEETGTVVLDDEGMTRTTRDVYATSFNEHAGFTYNWITSRKAEMDEETRRRVAVILINFFFSSLQLLISQMGQTIRADIFAVVQQGVSEGRTNTQIARDIRKAAPMIARRRAPVRAAAASVEGGSMGSHAAAKEIGGLRKVWWTTLDERTRRGERGFDHAAAHEQEVPVDTPFNVSGEFLNYPGDRTLGASAGNVVNCRCVPIFNIPTNASNT